MLRNVAVVALGISSIAGLTYSVVQNKFAAEMPAALWQRGHEACKARIKEMLSDNVTFESHTYRSKRTEYVYLFRVRDANLPDSALRSLECRVTTRNREQPVVTKVDLIK